MSGERDALARATRELGTYWEVMGSQFNGVMLARLADDIDAGGVAWDLLGVFADDPVHPVPGIRLLGGVHRLVLEGRAPELARHYQSVGGDGDVDASWAALHRVLTEHIDELRISVEHPPQTNEVGRSAGLATGMLIVTHETGLPLRLLEVGASAGLNLRLDRYWYESGGTGVGDADSAVRFVEPWEGGGPPLDGGLTVVERRGCDLRPLDPTTAEGRLMLSCFVPPDHPDRFTRLQAALDIAAVVPAPVDTADAADWLEVHLARLPEGRATVVFHSIMWQYLDAATDARARAAIEAAGATATAASPLARISYELPADWSDNPLPELRLRVWPGGEERFLGRTWPHGPPVHWGDTD